MSNIANVKRRGWSRASEMGSARQSSCSRSLLCSRCCCCCCCCGNTVNAACLCPAQSSSQSQFSFSSSSDSVRFQHVPFAIAMCHVCRDCCCARHEFLHRASSFGFGPISPPPFPHCSLFRRFLCVVRFVIKRRTWLLCLVVVQGKQMSGMTTYTAQNGKVPTAKHKLRNKRWYCLIFWYFIKLRVTSVLSVIGIEQYLGIFFSIFLVFFID